MRRYFTQEVSVDETAAISAIKQWSYPLNSRADLRPLFDRIGDSRIVMLGEASHGTNEYYTWRTHISRKLIEEKGFNFIAVEGDWPDCYRLNRFVKGYDPEHRTALKILHQFNRWPTWMWANWEVAARLNGCKDTTWICLQTRKQDFMVWMYTACGKAWKVLCSI